MDGFDFKLYDAADQAMSAFRIAYFGDDDAGEYPPSALLAGLFEHARYEGWNFEAACDIANVHGPVTSTDIASSRHTILSGNLRDALERIAYPRNWPEDWQHDIGGLSAWMQSVAANALTIEVVRKG